MSEPTSVIPKGSIILITGLTGYIATHIAQQLFAGGYNVRGTVRDLSKASWLKDELFSTEHAAGKLELVQVPDLAAPEAFNEAVKGVSGVAHVATITSFDPDPNNVIPQTVEGVLSLLRAAAAQPSVRRVVYTSTAAAAVMPMPGVEGQIGRDSWNDAAVQAAWAPPPYEGSRSLVTYIASKVEAEKAVWKFAKEQNPGFTVNVVSPFTTLGQALHPTHVRGAVGWVEQLWKGDTSQLGMLPAAIYVNVKDVATLHVAALLDPRVKEERIQAWATPFNWNDVLTVLRRLYPTHHFVDDLSGMGKILATTDDTLARRLLKEWAHQDEWTGFEDGIQETVKSFT
ncbi:hypothetical protein BGZ61DRAFT_486186 [Ilyonectria robusta]|uniref:uncharacterized protein n=1 Tax=Ilyonectria robusta TaxID=1079257 RepID=UPI001E8DC638|nr:uncharacterized protein BGZ61DRAFT_486186 [Ilyonectria robusta]KAH8658582.1 hypothetical protein BGZ61DRAFT_486186 [Ilyonectria robusta]